MNSSKILRGILYVFLGLATVVCLLPFYSMIISSTHTNADIAEKLLLLPGSQFMDNYNRLMGTVNIWRGLLNTIFVAVVGTAISIYFSAMVGYGFSKFDFPLKNLLFIMLLATMMIPSQLGIIGFYKLMNAFHMLNTYYPLIMNTAANAFGVFLIRQFAESSVQKEILEAGRIDGCGEFKMFNRIALPLLAPGLATLAIFVFISKWNDFLTPVIILFNNNLQTLPVMIASLRSEFSSDFGAQYVGIVISVVPILVFFSMMSKRIIGGIEAGALKG